MIPLHPVPEAHHLCPFCQVRLAIRGWYIPGMRCLADLTCTQCGHEFYGDLPSGHGLHYPMLIEKITGKLHDHIGAGWFAEWLRLSYAQRHKNRVNFEVEERQPIRCAILLNCLDRLYGHCVLKLLNAQYYLDHRTDLDLIVLVPRFLRWMVPDGVAAIWTVDLPLARGIEWNDWLAKEISHRLEHIPECYLSLAFCHPHPKDVDIERFSRTKPFPLPEWEQRLRKPTVTFIRRSDRPWSSQHSALPWRLQLLLNRREQSSRVVRLAKRLRMRFPQLDFAVVGLGPSGGLPKWILDLRAAEPNPVMEQAWCTRYAASHVVVGVHGSNMLLPSAHAGAIVELMPSDRWGNMIQDILLQQDDQRETLFRYRIIPLSASVETVCEMITSLLRDWPASLLHMQREWCAHEFLKAPSWSEARYALREHGATRP